MNKNPFLFPVREMREHISIRLPKEDKQFVISVARREKISQAAVIEAALKLLRKELENEKPA